MVALDLGEDFASSPIGEGILLVIRADKEHVAGEVVCECLVVNGADAYLEVADHDVALPQRNIGRHHHGSDVLRDSRVSSAWRARSASFQRSFMASAASSRSSGEASAQALA